MSAEVIEKVAFWNCGLAPLAKSGVRANDEAHQVAGQTVRQLVHQGAGMLGLCEVDEYRDVLDFFRRLPSSHIDPEDGEATEFEVLARISPTNGLEDTRKLCGLTWSESGYPVTVDSGTHIDGCHDAIALRRSLAQVLGRATTGRKLRALMQRHQERQASLKAEGSPPGELGVGRGAAGADDPQE